MRAWPTSALLAIVTTVAAAGPGRAGDPKEFCQAVQVIARAANADTGRWLDRRTRHDGVDVLCEIRTVRFKRFSTLPAGALNKAWRDAQEQDWNAARCTEQVWRPAIDDGWIIMLTVMTKGGERADVIATCP